MLKKLTLAIRTCVSRSLIQNAARALGQDIAVTLLKIKQQHATGAAGLGNMTLVYKITNELTNKAYIGYTKLTLNARLIQHFKDAEKYKGSSRKFYNSIQKYGTDCWISEVLYENLTTEQAKELEVKSIAEFDTYNNGYNSTMGGDGNNGVIMTDESNRKRSKALKGIPKDYDRMLNKTHTKETKQKISQAHRGMKKPWIKWTKEQIEKRRQTQLEKGGYGPMPHTEATKKKISSKTAVAVREM